MITEMVGWFGRHRIIYDQMVRDWRESSDDIDSIEVDCQETELLVVDGRLVIDSNEKVFTDTGGLFGGRTVVLNNAEAWEFKVKGPRNTKPLALSLVIDHFREMTASIRLGLIYRTEHPDEKIEEQCDPFDDQGIPGDPSAVPEWIKDYLKRNDVKITQKQCEWIVDHVGLDKQQLVEMVVSLGQNTSDGKVTASDIDRVADKMGAIEGYKIMSAVTSGDRAEAAEIFERVINKGMDIIPINAMLTNRFRQICVATNPEANLDMVAPNRRSHYPIMKDASRLGPDKSMRCLSLLTQNDYNIKGMGKLDEVLSTRIVIDQIAQICSG